MLVGTQIAEIVVQGIEASRQLFEMGVILHLTILDGLFELLELVGRVVMPHGPKSAGHPQESNEHCRPCCSGYEHIASTDACFPGCVMDGGDYRGSDRGD